jgi:hypothetical protein
MRAAAVARVSAGLGLALCGGFLLPDQLKVPPPASFWIGVVLAVAGLWLALGIGWRHKEG